MIKNIITYPTPTGIEYAPDVRVFDEELFNFIDDLKETATANNLQGLSAAQVGSYYNLVVIKQGEEFLELINPRVLSKKGKLFSTESSSYFGDISVEIPRYESISLVYEDRNGEAHSLKADGAFGILLQRKIDFLFGANFLTLLKDENRENFERLLNSNGASCPTTPRVFSRDYFIKAANYLMIIMILILSSSLFVSQEPLLDTLYKTQLYLSFVVVAINISYILYSYYENRKYSICTNCYNMSIFGVVGITLFRLTLLMSASYFLI